MTIYLAGTNSTDICIPNPSVEDTTFGIDVSFVNAGFTINGSNIPALSKPFGPIYDFWLHCDVFQQNYHRNSTYRLIEFNDLNDYPVIRLLTNSGGHFGVYVYDGSSYILEDDILGPFLNETRYTLDFNVRIDGENSKLSFYEGGIFVKQVEFDLITPIGSISFFNSYGSTWGRWSQIIVSDEATVGWKYYCKSATSDGTHTDGTGGYADIDEPLLNTVDSISLDTIGNTHTFKCASRDFSGFEVKQVQVSSLSRSGIVGPQVEQLVVRQDGVDYFSPDVPKSLGYEQSKWEMTTNPATGLPWTAAEAGDADLEFGIKATD